MKLVNGQEYLSTLEAAALYGCMPSNINYMIRTRRLPAIVIGQRSLGVLEADVLALKTAAASRAGKTSWIPPVKEHDNAT